MRREFDEPACRACGGRSGLMYLVRGAWLCWRCRRSFLNQKETR